MNYLTERWRSETAFQNGNNRRQGVSPSGNSVAPPLFFIDFSLCFLSSLSLMLVVGGREWRTLVDTAHVVVNLLLARAGGGLVLVAVTVLGDTGLAAGEVDDLDGLGGELAVLGTSNGNIGTVVVVLGQLVGGPGPDEQALVLLVARGDVGGDLDGPLIIGCRRE